MTRDGRQKLAWWLLPSRCSATLCVSTTTRKAACWNTLTTVSSRIRRAVVMTKTRFFKFVLIRFGHFENSFGHLYKLQVLVGQQPHPQNRRWRPEPEPPSLCRSTNLPSVPCIPLHGSVPPSHAVVMVPRMGGLGRQFIQEMF